MGELPAPAFSPLLPETRGSSPPSEREVNFKETSLAITQLTFLRDAASVLLWTRTSGCIASEDPVAWTNGGFFRVPVESTRDRRVPMSFDESGSEETGCMPRAVRRNGEREKKVRRNWNEQKRELLEICSTAGRNGRRLLQQFPAVI